MGQARTIKPKPKCLAQKDQSHNYTPKNLNQTPTAATSTTHVALPPAPPPTSKKKSRAFQAVRPQGGPAASNNDDRGMKMSSTAQGRKETGDKHQHQARPNVVRPKERMHPTTDPTNATKKSTKGRYISSEENVEDEDRSRSHGVANTIATANPGKATNAAALQ